MCVLEGRCQGNPSQCRTLAQGCGTLTEREDDMTTATLARHSATKGDLETSVRLAMRRAKVTPEQLRQQAESGRFSSGRARIAWALVSELENS